MSLFSVKDVFEFAVKIEVNGEYFYRETAKSLPDPKVKELFTFLANEEVKHKETFEKLAARMGSVTLPEFSNADYRAYLEAYTENLIFSDTDIKSKITGIDDKNVALLFAIDKELDTVHYYQEIKSLVPESEHSLIDKIIAEERNHVVKLAEMKRKLV
ncbi:MAG: ferritin family protein [Candidatus Marinimicrobia bacterium]|nr:ferritin family protein [Candidatus Neomarinimicrobiota bacterium]